MKPLKQQNCDMRITKILLSITVLCILVASCGLHKEYVSTASVPTDAYGNGSDITLAESSPSIAQLSWREFFIDPLLQQLIDTALVHNTDINSARIAVEKSQASLQAAKQAFFPSVYFSPSGSISSFDFSSPAKTYNLPLQVSWDADLFGSISNQKRKSEAILRQAQAQQEAVQANIISNVAQQYLTLLMLDRQLETLVATDSLWSVSLEAEKVLWDNGKVYSTAVNQLESSCLNVKMQIVDTRRNIQQVENAICRLLAITPQHIDRTHLGSYVMPARIGTGVPALLLTNRADVRAADFMMEEAFYNVQAARAAFYPSITLQGTAGWTNNAGSMVVNPGKILLSAVASLTQPIFARGQIKANYKIAQLTQEDMRNKYVQTVINAGNQVNEAIADYQAARQKADYYKRQVAVLKDAYTGTHELMDNGKANYLEVLTAQESLLNAQLNETMNLYQGSQALIALYIALGGATR